MRVGSGGLGLCQLPLKAPSPDRGLKRKLDKHPCLVSEVLIRLPPPPPPDTPICPGKAATRMPDSTNTYGGRWSVCFLVFVFKCLFMRWKEAILSKVKLIFVTIKTA